MRFKIIIRREHTGTDKLLGQDAHKVQQVLGVAVADVIDLVRRDRQPIFTGGALREPSP